MRTAKTSTAGMSSPSHERRRLSAALIARPCRPCRPVPAAEALLRGLVMVLQRDHQPLHRPQWSKRDDQDQRQPQHRVDPVWRVIHRLGDQGGPDHDEAGQKHDEHGRPVTGIDEAIVEPADLAPRPQRQESLEQFALGAARTGARQSGADRSRKRVDHLFAHDRIFTREPLDCPADCGPQSHGVILASRVRAE